jgi:hypothetical protein
MSLVVSKSAQHPPRQHLRKGVAAPHRPQVSSRCLRYAKVVFVYTEIVAGMHGMSGYGDGDDMKRSGEDGRGKIGRR